MTSVTNTAETQTLINQAAQKAGGIGGDFTMFLKLLTTQMQNQDPLDPMDTSEYTQQLVQYSQVEQSVQQTGVLKDILGRLAGQDMAQASAFIGKEARFATDVAGLGAEGGASWALQPARTPASLTVKITDSAGKTVREATLEPGATRFAWDGLRTDGSRAPQGSYRLAVEAKDAAGTIQTGIQSVGIVTDVVLDGSTVTLGVGGTRMPLADLVAVSAVRTA